MLETIRVPSFEALLQGIPEVIPRADLQLPPALSEPELVHLCQQLAVQNLAVQPDHCFLGAGAYHHWIPSVVRYLCSRGEFLTAYTPYQAEASQGTLQAMYEFQSLLCELTGMEVANASLYEGASALAEACLLAARETGRHRLVLPRTLHPEYRQTVQTYFKRSSVRILEAPVHEGVTDLEAVKAQIDSGVAAVVAQIPNAFGCLEPMQTLADLAHQNGALLIVVANPISLGILRPPGSYDADIVVGEGQPLGIDLGFGGPYLGLFACRESLMRKVPGRIVGMTRDAHGRRGFVLTLQAREQHIRRARATSNICTNEAMMALAATVYLSALGKEGFREVALQGLLKAHYCFDQLTKLEGVKALFPKPFFNEFAVELPTDPERVNQKLVKQGFLGGFPLRRWEPSLTNGWLVCVTETNSRIGMDRFVQTVKGALR